MLNQIQQGIHPFPAPFWGQMISSFVLFLPHFSLSVIHTYLHTLMLVHIRSSFGFSIFPEDTLTCRPEESSQWPSDNKPLALPLSLSRAPMLTLLGSQAPTSCTANWANQLNGQFIFLHIDTLVAIVSRCWCSVWTSLLFISVQNHKNNFTVLSGSYTRR